VAGHASGHRVTRDDDRAILVRPWNLRNRVIGYRGWGGDYCEAIGLRPLGHGRSCAIALRLCQPGKIGWKHGPYPD
jgi:hypothetical protein